MTCRLKPPPPCLKSWLRACGVEIVNQLCSIGQIQYYYYLNSFRGMVKPGTAGLGASKPDEPLPGDDEFDVYRKRMMLAYKYRPNPMVCIKCKYFLQIFNQKSVLYYINSC